MTEQKTLQEASVLEIKSALYDIGVQIENLIQQRQILTNELIERSKAETKTEPIETPTEEIKAE